MTTLVLCSHGTRSRAGQAVIAAVADGVRHRLPQTPVVEAVVDVEEHRIDRVLPQIAGPVVVVPLLLSTGLHVAREIAAAAARHPTCRVAPALGPSWALTDLAVTRLLEAGATETDQVVMAASASPDPAANRAVREAAHQLSISWGHRVALGYVGRRGRPLEQVVAEHRRNGRRVVVSSYLVAPGHFQTSLEACGADVVTAPLASTDPDTGLTDLVVHRAGLVPIVGSWPSVTRPISR